MAWVDDRAWCHPKLVGLSDRAFRAWINSVSYCSGMETHGYLERPAQRLLGASTRVRQELVDAGVWDDVDGAAITVHDWADHNGKRDTRKVRDRERKREQRALAREHLSAGRPEDRRGVTE